MKYETYKTLVLSTAHLPPELAERMDQFNKEEFIYQSPEYGYRVYVGSEGLPEEMKDAVTLAKSLDCRWIEYDCDGPEIEELKTYEW